MELLSSLWLLLLLLFLSCICSCAQGQDSVGSALAFSLFELARHPHVQELAVQELYEVFGDDQRVPSLSDLRRLIYLEQCIKETLRLYPSVPLILRMLTEDAKLGTARANSH
jgi:cytochrome P450